MNFTNRASDLNQVSSAKTRKFLDERLLILKGARRKRIGMGRVNALGVIVLTLMNRVLVVQCSDAQRNYLIIHLIESSQRILIHAFLVPSPSVRPNADTPYDAHTLR